MGNPIKATKAKWAERKEKRRQEKEKLEAEREHNAVVKKIKQQPSESCPCEESPCARCRLLYFLRSNLKDRFQPPEPDVKHPARAVRQQITHWVKDPKSAIPKMKILCLHDYNEDSLNLERHISGLISCLDDGHEFKFVDGPIELNDDRGTHYSWFETSSPADILNAHEVLERIIAEDGLFDGVLGFGQGAALATSFILQRQIERKPPLFDFAIMCSSIIAPSCDDNFAPEFYPAMWLKYGVDIQKQVKEHRRIMAYLAEPSPDLPAVADVKQTQDSEALHLGGASTQNAQQDPTAQIVKELTAALIAGDSEISQQIYDMQPDDFVMNAETMPRMFHPSLTRERIHTPTVQTWGSNDTFRTHAKLVKQLFDSSGVTLVVNHDAEHNFMMQDHYFYDLIEDVQKVMKLALLQKFCIHKPLKYFEGTEHQHIPGERLIWQRDTQGTRV
ncbi:uncharacterized protein LY89DRAFT_783963 [Mollisia scopiformis]|uniref:Serine hydrolase domain-containing protein n=1 Tax=Mollisia scopiformis TaxID=149040 RepID=A0A194X4C8_MOLSC|nr:uncharacterized protein LY89DRAFT_783963 [Mollisia scopiformis]KUJ14909.1 hypothetical protein LY89DRAFT_783963 [Mollisia scopiformis]